MFTSKLLDLLSVATSLPYHLATKRAKGELQVVRAIRHAKTTLEHVLA